jgi:hydroxyethylthiazole kinase-like uncharacterized protein yjeF
MKSLESYLSGFHTSYSVFDKAAALSHYKPREASAHKGNFGHALLMAGSFGKIGAAVIAAKACLATGAGLLTTWLPACGYEIMQTSLPEAMVQVDEDQFHLTAYPGNFESYQAAGLGPGIGTRVETADMLKGFLQSFMQPLILDADALNIIAKSPELFSFLKPNTIITPHPKEFDRLFGHSTNDLIRFDKAEKMAWHHKIIIVLKGHFTGVFLPDGKIIFNTTGNAGMAKGGSGDALTGIITALLAQSYPPATAASLGVYLHGSAGDCASELYSEEAMMATDLIHCLGSVFLDFKNNFRNVI